MSSRMLALYQQEKWALLPEEHIINEFFTPIEDGFGGRRPFSRESFPNITGKTFRYTFLPLADLSDLVIRRRATTGPEETASSEETIHTHPFTTLPVLTSHVHPKFVLHHLTEILWNQLGADNPYVCRLLETNPILSLVRGLRLTWDTAYLPPRAGRDPTFVPPLPSSSQDGLSDADSDATAPGHIRYPPVLRKIVTKNGVLWVWQQGRRIWDASGDISQRKRKKKGKPKQQLVRKRVHEPQSAWDKQSIANWAQGCAVAPPPSSGTQPTSET